MSSKIVALDFDGTCVINEFPKVGVTLPNCLEVLKALVEKKTQNNSIYCSQ